MIRRWFASPLDPNGFPAIACPVSGSSRSSAPSRPVGSEVVRASWLLSAPPSDAGGERAVPTPPGGSPHGFLGLPAWPQSARVKLAPSPPLTYRAPSGPNASSPIEWLGYCWHQSVIRSVWPETVLPLNVRRTRRPVATQPSVSPPGGSGQGSYVSSGRPHCGALPPGSASACRARTCTGESGIADREPCQAT